ncbi:ArsR/SmtB family transcription factor [Actinophytocola glycyrrhizae]|uniref:Helix-turn-helix domain-containing protein n=1 Tax=Actinophytocola glycyrrhizae TaxID=2044873 RepID=A0ABV9RZR5_9PSEU
MLLSLHLLQTQQGAVAFGGWRRGVRSSPPPLVRMLTTLARPKGYSPDFLTPPIDALDLDTALETVLGTDKRRLRTDIGVLATEVAVPAWVGGVAGGDVATLGRLAEAVRDYHAVALAPHWPVIRAQVRASWSRRAELAVSGGVGHMLDTLHPGARWDGSVLEVPYPVEQDLRLGGRGLTLVPSFFCWQHPITLVDPDHRPTLVYPVERSLDWAIGEPQSRPRPQSLGALLGRTRAAVLLTIAERPHLNTTQLARILDTSPASASQHATVLREAGLVNTHRHNGSAIHTLSSRGATLLAEPLRQQPGNGTTPSRVSKRSA